MLQPPKRATAKYSRPNGLSLSVLCAILLALLACQPDRQQRQLDLVLLVTVDTLRADHVWGDVEGRKLAPRMAELAESGAAGRSAYAPFGRTTQAVGTLLTGLHPLRHGADGLGMVLAADNTSVAEVFRDAGYRTAAFTSNYFLRDGLGFGQGFELYSCPPNRWEGNSADSITGEALAWLESQENTQAPLFLWLHYLDPHWTYEPPAEQAKRFARDWSLADERELTRRLEQANEGQRIFQAERALTAEDIRHLERMYQAEVAATDRAIGRLLDGLERLGLSERAAVLFTADHGESLGEHEYWFAHGEYAYDASLHVPFAVRAPGLVPAGTELLGNVGLADVAPTLAGLAELDLPGKVDGRDLTPWLREGGRQQIPSRPWVHLSDHRLVRDENPRRPVPGRVGRWWAVREGSYKLIRIPLGDGRHQLELYDTAVDPFETRDLSNERPAKVEELGERLDRREAELLEAFDGTRVPEPGAGDEDLEMLRSLGYVQ